MMSQGFFILGVSCAPNAGNSLYDWAGPGEWVALLVLGLVLFSLPPIRHRLIVMRRARQPVAAASEQSSELRMVDLKQVVGKEKLGPQVFEFYANPELFDGRVGVEMTRLMQLVAAVSSDVLGQGSIRDTPGFEGYPLTSKVTWRRGRPHWLRLVTMHGKAHRLFDATFRLTEDGLVEECFRISFCLRLPLLFKVDAEDGALILSLCKERHRLLSRIIDIRFTTEPVALGCLKTTGKLWSVLPMLHGEFVALLSPNTSRARSLEAASAVANDSCRSAS
jgi:hypothetical protein